MARKSPIDDATARLIYREYVEGAGFSTLRQRHGQTYKRIREAICRIGGPDAVRAPGAMQGYKKKWVPLPPLPEPGSETTAKRGRPVSGTAREIAVLLRAMVEERQMSQQDIARASGITKSIVGDVIRGMVPVRASDLDRWADALDVRWRITLTDLDGREIPVAGTPANDEATSAKAYQPLTLQVRKTSR